MTESQRVIAVRLIFLEHSLNCGLLSFESISGSPVLMELNGLVFDQVFRELPSVALKNHHSLTSYSFPGRSAHSQPTVPLKCPPFKISAPVSARSSFKTYPGRGLLQRNISDSQELL